MIFLWLFLVFTIIKGPSSLSYIDRYWKFVFSIFSGIESWWGLDFPNRPDGPWGPLSLLYNGYRFFLEGKAAGPWRSPPTPIEVKETVELYLYSTSEHWWPVLGWLLALLSHRTVSSNHNAFHRLRKIDLTLQRTLVIASATFFKIRSLHFAHRIYLCAYYDSEYKQRQFFRKMLNVNPLFFVMETVRVYV